MSPNVPTPMASATRFVLPAHTAIAMDATPLGNLSSARIESPLIEDGGDGGRANRVVAIDLETEQVRQYVYDNFLADKAKTFNSSELLALNDHELLVLERDGKGLGDDSKAFNKIDLAGAQGTCRH